MSIRTEFNWSPLFQDPGSLVEELAGAATDAAEEDGRETDDAMENAPKTGTLNPRTGKNRSARFEPPAKDRGTLLGSKSVERTGETEATLRYAAPHAEILQSEYLERPITPVELIPAKEEKLARKVEQRTGKLI